MESFYERRHEEGRAEDFGLGLGSEGVVSA